MDAHYYKHTPSERGWVWGGVKSTHVRVYQFVYIDINSAYKLLFRLFYPNIIVIISSVDRYVSDIQLNMHAPRLWKIITKLTNAQTHSTTRSSLTPRQYIFKQWLFHRLNVAIINNILINRDWLKINEIKTRFAVQSRINDGIEHTQIHADKKGWTQMPSPIRISLHDFNFTAHQQPEIKSCFYFHALTICMR